MARATYALHLTKALEKLDPPTDWKDIVDLVLTTINCRWRHNYCIQQLRKALDVGLRFGIIRELKGKYYLYEYGQIDKCGQLAYDFQRNPLNYWCETESEDDDDDDDSKPTSEDKKQDGGDGDTIQKDEKQIKKEPVEKKDADTQTDGKETSNCNETRTIKENLSQLTETETADSDTQISTSAIRNESAGEVKCEQNTSTEQNLSEGRGFREKIMKRAVKKIDDGLRLLFIRNDIKKEHSKCGTCRRELPIVRTVAKKTSDHTMEMEPKLAENLSRVVPGMKRHRHELKMEQGKKKRQEDRK